VSAAGGRLLGASEIRRLAADLELRPSKKWGQNFVLDANTVRRIVGAAEVTAADLVVEVGPGLGSLTLGLLAAGARLAAIEIDERLADRLPQTVAEHAGEHAGEAVGRLVVVKADALRASGEDVETALGGAPTVLVANLPYNVAVPVLLHLLAELARLRRVVVMVQTEVAERLCAPPGSRTYGSPSVKVAWWGTARLAGRVSRAVFWPVPNVDSSLVRVDVSAARRDEVLRRPTFQVVDAAFAQRRKTMRSALSGLAGSPAAAEAWLRRAEVDPQARGESLGIEDYLRLASTRSAAIAAVPSNP
jgi:16S rRNA (adenine1518-N6/adenine1519-N6)-dimethyltransferase